MPHLFPLPCHYLPQQFSSQFNPVPHSCLISLLFTNITHSSNLKYCIQRILKYFQGPRYLYSVCNTFIIAIFFLLTSQSALGVQLCFCLIPLLRNKIKRYWMAKEQLKKELDMRSREQPLPNSGILVLSQNTKIHSYINKTKHIHRDQNKQENNGFLLIPHECKNNIKNAKLQQGSVYVVYYFQLAYRQPDKGRATLIVNK